MTARFWSEAKIARRLQEFEERTGRRPTYRDAQTHKELPSPSIVDAHCGSWANAQVLAFGIATSKGDHAVKDEDTRLVLEELAKGRSLASIARDRGISGQALGRRVRRYREAYGLADDAKVA